MFTMLIGTIASSDNIARIRRISEGMRSCAFVSSELCEYKDRLSAKKAQSSPIDLYSQGKHQHVDLMVSIHWQRELPSRQAKSAWARLLFKHRKRNNPMIRSVSPAF